MSSPARGTQTPADDGGGSAPPATGPHRHRRVVTVGLIAVGVCIVLGAAAGITAWLTHGFRGQFIVRYHQAAIFSVRAGDCINLTPNGTEVHIVPCAGRHDAEVFGTFHLSGTAWPGHGRGPAASRVRLREPAHRLPEPAARHEPDAGLRVPGAAGVGRR